MVTIWLDSIPRKSFSSWSLRSEAVIARKLMAPCIPPIWQVRVLNAKALGAMKSFADRPDLGRVLPVESEFGFTAHVEQIVHQPQPAPSRSEHGRRAQTPEIVEDIVLQMVQAGLGLPHGCRLNAKGDELGLGQAVVALASWVFSI